MGLIVGEAEVLITANTAGLEAGIAASSDPALTKLESDAGTAGEDAGTALTTGLASKTKDIGKDTESALKDSTGRMSGLVSDFSNKASSSLENLGVPSALLTGPGVLAIGLAATAAAALDLGMKMQSADAAIAASSGISTSAATAIGNAFLDTAGKSTFSGQQMAVAFAPVAGQLKSLNGAALSTQQSLDFMTHATDLAEASGHDLTTTTATLAGTLQAFQMPVSQAAAAGSVLFNVSNATGQSMDTVASSLEKVRARLGDTSPPLSQLGALMLDMTKNGITGRGALTALNTAMTGLVGAATGTTSANMLANQTLKEYGVNALQANGQLTPLSTIIGELAPKFSTMTQAQQLQTATTIFGASAAKQMVTVIDAGTKSFNDATTAVNNNNAVTDAAAKKQDTLAGEFDILKSSLVDAGTKLGEALLPVVQDLVGVIEKLIPILTGGLDVALGAIEPLVDTLTNSFNVVLTTLEDVGNFIKDVFTGDWSGAWDEIKNIVDEGVKWVENSITEFPKVVIGMFDSLPSGIKSAIEGIVDAIESPFITAFNFVINLYNDTIGKLPSFLGGGHINDLSATFSGSGSKAISTNGSGTPNAELIPGLSGSSSSGSLTDAEIKNNAAKIKGKDVYKAPSSSSGSSGSSSTALDSAELALQAQGQKALNDEVAAIHSKNLTKLETDVDEEHKKALTDLETKLDATHNTKLEAMATKLETDFTSMETAKNAILATDSKNASTALNAQLSLTTSSSLTTLNTQLDATHNAALVTLETKLDDTHNKNLEGLVSKLVTVHQEAMQNLVEETLAAQASEALKMAGGQAGIIADQQTVADDYAQMGALTGSALAVAQAQLALDQQKLSDDQQTQALQAAVDAAAPGAAAAAATAALDNQEAQAKISEANLQAALDWQNTLKSVSDASSNAASAASSTASAATVAATADTTTAAVASVPSTSPTAPAGSTSTTTINLTIAPGAIVITPAPGNDAASLIATEAAVNAMLQELVQELGAGLSPLGTS
jgi:TP901 family phage tail tape measure protein